LTATDAKYFLITIDVEDWFHVENFKSLIPFDTWAHQVSRIERNMHRLLDLFDSVDLDSHVLEERAFQTPLNGRSDENRDPSLSRPMDGKMLATLTSSKKPAAAGGGHKVRATFFVLCWIAEHFPHVVREIAARGHEVASHGCYHELPENMLPHLLRAELSDSRKRLEDTIGMPCA
jgi:hypothetical protein